MRVPAFAFCTLATLVAGELSQQVAASVIVEPSPNTQDLYVVPTVEVTTLAEGAIAPPETLATQEFSTVSTATTADAKPGITASNVLIAAEPIAAEPIPPTATSLSAEAPVAAPVAAPVEIAQVPTPAPVAAPGMGTTVTMPPEVGDLAVTALDVQISGGSADLQQLVRQTIQTQPGASTSRSQLQSEVAELLGTGLFANVQATASSQAEGVSVVYEIVPVVVRAFQVSSNAKALTAETLNQLLANQVGQPVSPAALQAGIEQINQWYRTNGYTLAQVVALLPSQNGVMTIEVAEGVVGDINLRFVNETGRTVDEEGRPVQGRTRESVIRQELQLQPGQVFNENTARQDLQTLYGLGLFDDVNISLGGDSEDVTVTYEFEERLARAVNFGGGYSDNSGIFGSINYQDQNIGGTGDRLSSDIQVSGRGLQFDGAFTSPYRESNPDRLGYSVNAVRRRALSRTLTDEVVLPSGSAAREGRFGGGVSVMRPLGDWNAEAGLNYNRISIRDGDGEVFAVDELGNPLTFSSTGVDDLTTLSLQLSQDRRNNPFNPSAGSIVSLRTEQSVPVGNGGVLMNRLQANYSQYVPIELLNLSNGRDSEVLAFNLQGGTVLGDAASYNAFNLGGQNSVRGFQEGRLGTGRSYVLASAEYRFPVVSALGGVVFADFASDLGSADTVLGEPGVVRDQPGTGFGYGLGVRVQSPLGVIRADYGLTNTGDSRLHFGLGQRF